jgi:hypothetical protein
MLWISPLPLTHSLRIHIDAAAVIRHIDLAPVDYRRQEFIEEELDAPTLGIPQNGNGPVDDVIGVITEKPAVRDMRDGIAGVRVSIGHRARCLPCCHSRIAYRTHPACRPAKR